MSLIITVLLLVVTVLLPSCHLFLTNQECSVEEKQEVLEEMTQVDGVKSMFY
jgi:hypothetical protein